MMNRDPIDAGPSRPRQRERSGPGTPRKTRKKVKATTSAQERLVGPIPAPYLALAPSPVTTAHASPDPLPASLTTLILPSSYVRSSTGIGGGIVSNGMGGVTSTTPPITTHITPPPQTSRTGYAANLLSPPSIMPGGLAATPRVQGSGNFQPAASRRRSAERIIGGGLPAARASEERLRDMARGNASASSLAQAVRIDILGEDDGAGGAATGGPRRRRRRVVNPESTGLTRRLTVSSREEGRALGLARGASMRRVNVWDDLPDQGDPPPPFPFPTSSNTRLPPTFSPVLDSGAGPPALSISTDVPAPPDSVPRSPPPSFEQATRPHTSTTASVSTTPVVRLTPLAAVPEDLEPTSPASALPSTGERRGTALDVPPLVIPTTSVSAPSSTASPSSAHFVSAPTSPAFTVAPSAASASGTGTGDDADDGEGDEDERADRRLWNADLLAGYSLEDRVKREAARKLVRETQGGLGLGFVLRVSPSTSPRKSALNVAAMIEVASAVEEVQVDPSVVPSTESPYLLESPTTTVRAVSPIAPSTDEPTTFAVDPSNESTATTPTGDVETPTESSVRQIIPESLASIVTTAHQTEITEELLKSAASEPVDSSTPIEPRQEQMDHDDERPASRANSDVVVAPPIPVGRKLTRGKAVRRTPTLASATGPAMSPLDSPRTSPKTSPRRSVHHLSGKGSGDLPFPPTSSVHESFPITQVDPPSVSSEANKTLAPPTVRRPLFTSPYSLDSTVSKTSSVSLSSGPEIHHVIHADGLEPRPPLSIQRHSAPTIQTPPKTHWARKSVDVTASSSVSPAESAPARPASASSATRNSESSSALPPSREAALKRRELVTREALTRPPAPNSQPVPPSLPLSLPLRPSRPPQLTSSASRPPPPPLLTGRLPLTGPLIDLTDDYPETMATVHPDLPALAASTSELLRLLELDSPPTPVYETPKIADTTKSFDRFDIVPVAESSAQGAAKAAAMQAERIVQGVTPLNVCEPLPRRSATELATSPITPRPAASYSQLQPMMSASHQTSQPLMSGLKPPSMPTRRPPPPPPPVHRDTESTDKQFGVMLPPPPPPPPLFPRQSFSSSTSSLSDLPVPIPEWKPRASPDSPVRPRGPRALRAPPPVPPRPWAKVLAGGNGNGNRLRLGMGVGGVTIEGTSPSPTHVRPLVDRRRMSDNAVSSSADTLTPLETSPTSPRSQSVADIRTSIRTSPQLEYTDIDVFVARLEGSGQEFEGLSHLTQFLGPAKAPAATPAALATLLPGPVLVDSRRTNARGKVKLKLSILGARVSTCPICLAQFRSGETGVILPRCGHAAHEACARRWFRESDQCMVCREPLGED